MGLRKNKLLVLMMVALTSCTKQEGVGAIQYVNWVENPQNGIKVEKQIGDFDFEVQYKPYEYIVLKNKRNTQITKEQMLTEVDSINGLQYYTLKIGLHAGEGDLLKYNLHDVQSYTDRVNYFSFGAQSDIKLVDGNDTLSCALLHFERTYGLTPYINLILAFQKDTSKVPLDKTLIYDDKMLGVGKIKVTVQGKDIKRVPNLIL